MIKRVTVKPEGFVILIILAITTAFTSLANDLITPTLPLLATIFQVTPERMQGSLFAFFVGFGVAHLFWGSLSDIYGRRIIMLIGIMIFCLSTMGCIITQDIDLHLTFRFLQGIGGAAGMILTRAIVRDIYGAERTTKAMSNVITLFVPVTIILPMLGGFLFTHFKWNTTFWTMEIIGILAFLAVFVFLIETAPTKLGKQKKEAITISALSRILSERSFLRNTFSNMFGFTALLIFLANFPNILVENYGLNPQQNGYFLAAFGASLSVGVLIVRLLVPRYTVNGSIYLGAGFSAFGWGIILLINYFLFPSISILITIICISTIGLGVMFTLTPGQAMVPFTQYSGTASSIYGILQYGGASTIAHFVGKLHNGNILPVVCTITTLIIFALINYRVLKEK